jgi:hypothetical protein
MRINFYVFQTQLNFEKFFYQGRKYLILQSYMDSHLSVSKATFSGTELAKDMSSKDWKP